MRPQRRGNMASPDRIAFLEGDLFSPLPPGQSFDIILSNPPYVHRDDLATLEREVRKTSSRTWLWTAARMASRSFHELIANAQVPQPSGHLLVEIGHDQEAGREETDGGRKRCLGTTWARRSTTVRDTHGLSQLDGAASRKARVCARVPLASREVIGRSAVAGRVQILPRKGLDNKGMGRTGVNPNAPATPEACRSPEPTTSLAPVSWITPACDGVVRLATASREDG